MAATASLELHMQRDEHLLLIITLSMNIQRKGMYDIYIYMKCEATAGSWVCKYVYEGQGTKGPGTMKQMLYGPLGQKQK